MSQLTRRAFLQTSIAAGGVAITAKSASWLLTDRRVNFAVLGSNQSAVNHLAALASAPNARVSLVTGNTTAEVRTISKLLREQDLQAPRFAANHQEAFLDPNIDALCVAGHQLYPMRLFQAAFASGKPIFFDVPPTDHIKELARAIAPESYVVTCLDGLCSSPLPASIAAAHALGEIHTVVLRMTKAHPVAGQPSQFSMLAALFDAALIAFPLKQAPGVDIAGQGEHPIFSNLKIIRAADRSNVPELLLAGSRSQALLAAKPQLPYAFLRNRLSAFINTLASGGTPVCESGRRHFLATALAQTILQR